MASEEMPLKVVALQLDIVSLTYFSLVCPAWLRYDMTAIHEHPINSIRMCRKLRREEEIANKR